VDEHRWQRLQSKLQTINRTVELLDSRSLEGVRLSQLLRRPEIGWQDLVARVAELGSVDDEAAEQVTYDIKYAGYVTRQQQQIARQQRLAEKRIPSDFDYHQIVHLRTEARQKLTKIRPASLDQASRISGITPADIALLMAHLQR
jgi:tRNA uridine 5-carboxymethylaminomethyl modification enzyme